MVENLSEKSKSGYNELKQRILEDMVASEIERYYPDARILQNIHIPKSIGKSTEIDILVLDTQASLSLKRKI